MLADRSLASWSLRLTLANQPDRSRNVRIGSPGCLVAQYEPSARSNAGVRTPGTDPIAARMANSSVSGSRNAR